MVKKATPDMTDPNGATVRSQTVPSGYQAKEGDYYTYSIVDLTNFNKRYHTNYYTRAYKRFDASTDTTVELVDKNTGNVLETRTVQLLVVFKNLRLQKQPLMGS